MLSWTDRIPLYLFLVAALTLGLSPFLPEPHLWEKLKMLADGTLGKPIDIFDLVLHATPWVLLILKLLRLLTRRHDAALR
ncbi:RND transporter [Thiocapsa sp.]|uniref:RND transporter n=1 Tax=Thiocapsa sp. TaxID=2024551 RepID=UPI0035937C58